MSSLIKGRWVFVGGCAAAAVLAPIWLLYPDEDSYNLPPMSEPGTLAMKAGGTINRAIMALPFSPTRDPDYAMADAQAASGGEAAATPLPSVVGIVSRLRGAAVALVKAGGGATTVVHAGDEIDGWKILAIGRDSVTFEKGGDKQVAALDYSNKPQGVSPDGTGAAPQ